MGAPRIPPKPPWPHSIFLGLSCCSPCFRVADFPSPKFSCLPPQPFLRSSCLGEADGFEEVGDQHMRDASSIGRPFGHDESFNMGVYPGRGPALISRADMIILPSPITIDSFAFADNTFAVVVDVAPSPEFEDTQHPFISFLIAIRSSSPVDAPTSPFHSETFAVTAIAESAVTEIIVMKSSQPPRIPKLF